MTSGPGTQQGGAAGFEFNSMDHAPHVSDRVLMPSHGGERCSRASCQSVPQQDPLLMLQLCVCRPLSCVLR